MPVYKLTYNAIISIEVFANTWEGAIEKGEHILNDDVMIAKYHHHLGYVHPFQIGRAHV